MPGGWVAVRTGTTEESWQDPFEIMWDDKQNMSEYTLLTSIVGAYNNLSRKNT